MPLQIIPFTAGQTPWLLLCADTADVSAALPAAAERLAGCGWAAAELRCLPQDTPRHFDPVSLEGDAVGGPAVAVQKDAWQAAGGLDPLLPDASALLDLSLRLRAQGGTLGYCPLPSAQAVRAPAAPETAADYAAELTGRAVLACKYGTPAQARAGQARYISECRAPSRHFPGVRKALLAGLPGMLTACAREKPCRAAAWEDVIRPRAVRGVCPLVPFEAQPLVSVIVRTCGRPDVLCQTLRCLRHQTYRNFEVVLVEDGPAQSRAAVEAEFADLPVRYHATGTHVGRGRAGNIGLEQARGELVCFLDDDDFLYPDALEQGAAQFYQGPEKDLVLAGSMAGGWEVLSLSPYRYVIHDLTPMLFDHIDLMDMCVRCRIPMPGAMFRRELYAVNGGMREDLDGDEDWAMWLRFWRTARRADDTRADIPRALSLFGCPADSEEARRRLERYAVFDEIMLDDPALCYTVPVEKARGWVRRLKGDLAHLAAHGGLEDLLATARPEKAWRPVLPQAGGVTLTAR